MTYHPTDNDDDGTVEADVDNTSVSTENLDSRQGYNNVTASRSLDTQFTNNTGADLTLAVTALADVNNTNMRILLRVDGVDIQEGRLVDALVGDKVNVNAVVPDKSTYEVAAAGDTADFSLDIWAEQS